MKRRVPALVVAVILLVAGLRVYLPLASEPKFQGRRVSYWFKEYCGSGQNGNYDWIREREALAALQKMGTNAVPYLLEQAFSIREDSAAKSNLYRFINEAPRSWGLPLLVNARTMCEEAPFALEELKPPAGQILPLLQKHLKSTSQFERNQALIILGTVGDGAEQAVPYLAKGLEDTNGHTRLIAMQSLGWIGPRAEASVPALIEVLKESPGTNHAGMGLRAAITLGKIGGAAVPAAPLVRKLFEQEANWSSRCSLATALFRIDPGQTDALAFLMDGVTNHQPANDRGSAVWGLGEIGPGAKMAVPALLQALDSTNAMLYARISTALKQMGVPPETFLPAMKKQLEANDPTTRVNAAARVLEIVPADHEAHLVLMKEIEQGALFQDFAIETLGGAGPAASEAIPILRKLAKKDPQGKRDREAAAAKALKRIEAKPEGKN
ncbi:MAG: repeat-containing protein [Pedosphaera sp.]|nr:repeat-containing protein [Pedosphaera sp.]